MPDTPLIPPKQDKTPPSYATEPPRRADYAELPPGITLKQDTIALKKPSLAGSVSLTVFFSLITFYMPLFNGLLGGAIGGFHAKRMKRALGVAVASSVLVPTILAFAHFISQQPRLLFLMGLTTWEWVALHVIGTLLGAVAGAVASQSFTEAPLPGSAAAPESSRAGPPAVPPSEPVHVG
jgi:hypothetical protein